MGALTGITSMKNAGYAAYKTRRSYQTTTTAVGKGKSTSKSTKKKSPRYSFKQVSSQIMRAKNSVGAAQAYQAARRKLGELRRLSGNSVYDQEEVEIAIRHAESIVRVARKKRNHLSEEERAERERRSRDERDELENEVEESLRDGAEGEIEPDSDSELSGLSDDEIQELMEEAAEDFSDEMTEDMEEAMRELEEELAQEEQMEALSELMSPNMSEEDIEDVKKKHRAKELLEITKADMKYLKAMFEKYQRERTEGSSGIYSSGGSSDSGSASGGMSLSAAISGSASVPSGGFDATA